jgi:penicillin V acylase-like amidase (Ntn superfamily)
MNYAHCYRHRPTINGIPPKMALNSKGCGVELVQNMNGFAGANGFGVHDAIIDGLNEKGLYVGLFYFPGCAKYMEPTQDNNAKGLAPWEFGTWVLANFSTVDEVNAAIARIALIPTYLNTLKEVPAAHYKIQDAKGHCIVVEPTDGQLKVYDNPVWAMANSPEFPWHLTNLNNYIHLSAVYPASKTIRGLSPLENLRRSKGAIYRSEQSPGQGRPRVPHHGDGRPEPRGRWRSAEVVFGPVPSSFRFSAPFLPVIFKDRARAR